MDDQHVRGRRGEERIPPILSARALALAGILAIILGWLVYGIKSGAWVVGVDHRTTTFVVAHRTPMLSAMATAVTFFGNEVTLSLLTLVVVGTLWLRQARHRAAFFAISMAGSAVFTEVGKYFVMRARPPVGDVVGAVVDHSYSFPSGHTLTSAVFVIALLCVVTPLAPTQTVKVFLLVAGSFLEFGIGLSRLYLGFHWLSDVVGAWLIAVIWMTVMSAGLAAARRRSSRDADADRLDSGRPSAGQGGLSPRLATAPADQARPPSPDHPRADHTWRGRS
jgi:undecaprenyl-diphosphatase